MVNILWARSSISSLEGYGSWRTQSWGEHSKLHEGIPSWHFLPLIIRPRDTPPHLRINWPKNTLCVCECVWPPFPSLPGSFPQAPRKNIPIVPRDQFWRALKFYTHIPLHGIPLNTTNQPPDLGVACLRYTRQKVKVGGVMRLVVWDPPKC